MFEDKRWLPAILVSPVLVLLFVLIGIPSVFVAWLSFTESTLGAESTFVGFDNYRQIFSDPIFWRASLNTFVIVNVVVYSELLIALLLALALNGKFFGKGLIFSILIAPYAVSEVSAVVMWQYAFEPDVGIFNVLLEYVFGIDFNWTRNPFQGLVLISILSIWIHLPFTFIILYSAISTVPDDLKDAARVEGASERQVFRFVTFRIIAPAVLIALMFRYIFAMRLFSEAWLLTEGGPARLTEVLGIYLFRSAFRYLDFGVAAATGIAMQFLSLLVASFYLYRLYKGMKTNA
jgi:multiple sugar transport system permease protein